MTDRAECRVPGTYLEKQCARLALDDAVDLVDHDGLSADEAARLACTGSWSEWRGWVLALLGGPGECARAMSRDYVDPAAEARRRADWTGHRTDSDFWFEVADLLDRR